MFVISAALTETGLTERIGAGIARAAGAREWRAILVVMPAVAALAAFSHHLMITAMMLPIMMRLARVQNLSPSRLLMPMSLAASLGTTLTIFSAPAFLLMNHLLLTGGQDDARHLRHHADRHRAGAAGDRLHVPRTAGSCRSARRAPTRPTTCGSTATTPS